MTNTAWADSLIGQHLDEYRLEAMLGQGGMARVYRGFDLRLRRPVAVKVIHSSPRADSEYVMRFEREAQAIAKLKHPRIVEVYRYGEANGLLYIAMEYIEGTDLASALAAYAEKQQLIPPMEAMRIIRQVCLALDYTHSRGVIHRDVKPSNIMLNSRNDAVLTDFGLALLTEVGTQGQIFGTPQYIAPEQAISSANVVPQSDLYAVGVILYEMFTGHLPFTDPSPFILARLHVDESIPSPRKVNPDLTPRLEAVIVKALAKEPAGRYLTGAALAAALEQALTATSEPHFSGQGENQVLSPAVSPPLAAGESISQPGEKDKPMTKRFILKNIQALLIEGFTAEDLRELCFYEPGFTEVYNKLPPNPGKAEIVKQLLEYAKNKLQLEQLLKLAKEYNPARYEKHQPYYELVDGSSGEIPPPDEGLIGKTLGGKYEVIELLGRGGMATVYKAYQSSLSRYVAIKIVDGDRANSEELVERFEHEAIAIAGLHHSNIVQVFDRGQEAGLYYMVMLFVAGPTLEVELKRRKAKDQLFLPEEITAIFYQLASAIDYAHGQGIIHRDLKPSNIMFTVERRIVLTDFGIARQVNVPGYTVPGMIIGTPAYMSPEQVEGQPVSRRSDIYSLGVILYEMLTGRVPFTTLMQHVSEPPPLPTKFNPTLPKPVEQVILKALSKNPDERYQTAGELARVLAEAVTNPLPKLPPPPPDTKILQILHAYFLEHPGDPKIDLNELVAACQMEQTEMIRWLYKLREKKWLDFELTDKAEGGLVWLTDLGIKVARSIQGK